MRTVPPLGASTRAAALARRNAKSTVSGFSPTLPRTPSVPKYLRPIEALSLVYRHGHAHRIEGGRHVVGAHDTRSMENRNGGQGHTAGDSGTHVTPREPREQGFA